MSDSSGVVSAFTAEQASRLTGISPRQLGYWASGGFFVPSIDLSVDDAAVRLYSFRDLVCLRIINVLRNESRVSLQQLRALKSRLSDLGDDLWARTTLYVLNRRVVIVNPRTGEKEDALTGQGILRIPLEVVAGDVRDAIRALRSRPVADHGQIDTRRGGANNPLISGTRISVRAIRNFADAGFTAGDILKQYPSLTEADVEAALQYRLAA